MDPLFKEFPPVSPEDWTRIAGNLEDTRTLDGISIPPICFPDGGDIYDSAGLRTPGWSWQVVPLIPVDHLEAAIKGGADAVEINCTAPLELPKNGIKMLLSGEAYAFDSYPPGSEILINPLAANEPALAYSKLGENTINADATAFGMSGANASDELAYTLATAVEYTRHLSGQGIAIDVIAPALRVVLPLGGHSFFIEVAKIRALRRLWATVVQALGGKDKRLFIHSKGDGWNKKVIGSQLNIARGAVEGLAATIGGCNSLDVMPHDTTGTGLRIALNTQHILREEAGIDRVADPAAGSRLIESLTAQLAACAWTEFQEIERLGGMEAALKSGRLESRVKSAVDSKNQRLEKGEDILVGYNRFQEEAIS